MRRGRRWFQFGLGTMLAIVTLLCVWLAWQVRVVRERKLLLASARQQGAIVTAVKDRIEWQGLVLRRRSVCPSGGNGSVMNRSAESHFRRVLTRLL